MSVPATQASLAGGELAPALWGRMELARFHIGASTMRNFYVGYRGGAYSRAGTRFVGFSKQTGRAYPPRLVPFQFNINQGMALELGQQYMRVISNGGYVVDQSMPILGISQAKPAVVTVAPPSVTSATPVNGGVFVSYAPGEIVTLAGGVTTQPAKVTVLNTELLNIALGTPGHLYKPGDVINLAGGAQTTQATVVVVRTKIISASLVNAGVAGPPGTAIVQGTTGGGAKFQVSVSVFGGIVTAINGITYAGSYTTNPTTPTAEPVVSISGAAVTGCILNVTLGIDVIAIQNPGVFMANPVGNMTQGSTSGAGVGATFSNALLAPNAVSVTTPGVYTTLPSNPVHQASTTGSGAGAQFIVQTAGLSGFANGDWIPIAGVAGMTALNGQTFVIGGLTPSSFELFDVYGNPIDTTAFPAYAGGGIASRIFTLPTPYSEEDLPWLKFTESADVMSLCLVNQQSGVEYQQADLVRNSAASWTLAPMNPAVSVAPPATASGTASSGGGVDYQYQVTAVAPDGTESIASPIASINSAVNIATTAGTITVSWGVVPGVVNTYNIYKATPSIGSPPPAGSLFGFVGSAYGTSFVDSNIVADYAQVPPTHQNPFARGQIIDATPTPGGSGYTTITLTIQSTTGTGAVLQGLLVAGALSAIIIKDPGENYRPADTVLVTGDGTGAAVTLTIGAQTGTYPGVVAYFQQRRMYGYTLNNPDTYFGSQTGAFTNFDSRDPPIDSDAVIGSPWATQVNGIQFMLQIPPGLLLMTGLSAWLIPGSGAFATNATPLAPANQNANPQAFSGCSPTVPPIKINYDVLYVNSRGSFYYDLPYQLYALSEPIDLTINSTHLFTGHMVREHAWCEQPYKLLWSVRDDGTMLSLAFLKAEQVAGWSRHDTNGLFLSACAVIEGTSDALYVATQRFPGANTAYMIERMDNRIWPAAEDAWCVDCGLALPQPAPAATLTASSPAGLGAVTGATNIVGGAGYSAAATGTVIDGPITPNGNRGPGTGAVPTLTFAGGQLTAVAFAPANQGQNYVNPLLLITDPAGSAGGAGASATLTLANTMTFSASAPVFAPGNVGNVIRANGGIAVITAYVDPQHVTANMLSPMTQVRIDGQGNRFALPATAGNWTMTAPVTTIGGLDHLIGATVTGLADGNVVPPTVVSAAGTIALPPVTNPNVTGYTAVTIGLGYQAQLQSMDIIEEGLVLGQRKKISAVTLRLESSRGLKIATDQLDGSAQSPPDTAPSWVIGAGGLVPVPDTGPNFPFTPVNALARALRTGDIRIPVGGGFQTSGRVAIQQDNPLPANVLALINEVLPGDTPEAQASSKRKAA